MRPAPEWGWGLNNGYRTSDGRYKIGHAMPRYRDEDGGGEGLPKTLTLWSRNFQALWPRERRRRM